jgi:branched-chain amino acid transport system substrate-binding protein
MKRFFILSTFLIAALGLVAGNVTAAEKKKATGEFKYEDKIGVVKIKKGDPIHIACWFVVAGPDATLGLDTKYGVEIAAADEHGKLLGHPIQITVEDTGCNPEGGQAAATKIASDPTVVAAVGSNCSSAAKPGVPILWKAGIVTVSPSNTAPYLTDPKRGHEYDGYLRTAHNDRVQGSVAAEFAIKYLKVKKAATIHDGSVYAEQLQEVFAEKFKSLGGTITSQEAVAPTDTDMRPVLTKIATGHPDLIYFPIFVAAGGYVARQSREVPGLEKVHLMAADGCFSPDFYKAAGEAAVGMFHSSPDFSAFAGGYEAFLAKYKKLSGSTPIAPFHAHAYDAAIMIFDAIKKVGKTAPDGTLYIGRNKLRDALYETKNYKGLTGNLTCTALGDCADPHIAVYQTTKENVDKLVMPDKPIWKPY